ncbi:MAG TPA: SH3 domain-containing protein, partial [Roseiflexaceae bacterium]|nr:SH3 domain-containing protein [Roseiflexaceae bacterium]
RFDETTPGDSRARAAAALVETPNPCLDPSFADCAPGDVRLTLYSRDGQDFWAWLVQQQAMLSYSPQGDFVDLVLAGRPAVAWPGDGIFFGSYNVYAMPVGDDALLISGAELDQFVSGLQLQDTSTDSLAVGQVAMTKPGSAWDFWSATAGGTRLDERPQLYEGAFVTILATEDQAVQVRTSEGVTGWIRAAAADALTPQVAPLGEQARFTAYAQARIADGYTIPLRESPRSTAAVRGQPAKSGQELTVMGVRGDWLRVFIPEVGEGWMRWYYDGAQYIELVNP